jgi:hypothetical protein
METERPGSAGLRNDQRAQQQALLTSLHAAVDALAVCVERLHELIEQVNAMGAPDEPPPRVRPRISYGGGPSALAVIEARPAPPSPEVEEPTQALPSTSALMAAAEMAHRGYSRGEIAERLHERWGGRAAGILHDVME